MKAPIYAPAKRFVRPQRVKMPLSTKDTAIADLKANPAAWQIVESEIPSINARIGGAMIKPHLGNFSFRSLVQFGAVSQDDLDRIDKRLSAMETGL